jgi:thymidylate synthase (FAD)
MPDFSYLSDVQKNLCETAVKEFGAQVEEAYAKLKDFGAKNEDARAVLPNCASTSFMVTMNCRSLLNFFRHRCCYRAQTEIRDVAWAMLEQVRVQLPVVFAKAGPRCMTAKRCLEDKPCGMNPWKVKHEEVTQL